MIFNTDEYINAATEQGLKPVELTDVSSKTKEIVLNHQVTGGDTVTLDCNFWLPLAAEHYCISKNIRDYILVPVPSVITEMPNTNGDSVTKQELLQFNPDLGMPAYKTFKGKGTYREHANTDISKAKGVILEVYLKPLLGFGNNKHFKMVKLLAFDRTKDPTLCNNILSGMINTYSMGMYYTLYSCSVCGATVSKGSGKPCSHTALKVPTYKLNNGKLAYRLLHNITGFETSVVADPAFSVALSNLILNPRKKETYVL